MPILITICARAGSKGFPGKHLRMFNGKPLIQWTLEQAERFCERFHELGARIVVSTNDSDIMRLASLKKNVIIHERRDELAQDDTGKIEVLRSISRWLIESNIEAVIDLDATNPCRTVDNIKKAFDLFHKSKADVVFSVTPAKKNPWFNQVEIVDGFPFLVNDGNGFVSRQKAPNVFDMNSSIYVYRPSWLANESNAHPVCLNSRAYVMPRCSFCDIDHEEDFVAAKALHRRYYIGKDMVSS